MDEEMKSEVEPTAALATQPSEEKRFEIKKWNAVALWSWGSCVVVVATAAVAAAGVPIRPPSNDRSGSLRSGLTFCILCFCFWFSPATQILWSTTALFAAITLWTCALSARPIRRRLPVRSALWPGASAVRRSLVVSTRRYGVCVC